MSRQIPAVTDFHRAEVQRTPVTNAQACTHVQPRVCSCTHTYAQACVHTYALACVCTHPVCVHALHRSSGTGQTWAGSPLTSASCNTSSLGCSSVKHWSQDTVVSKCWGRRAGGTRPGWPAPPPLPRLSKAQPPLLRLGHKSPPCHTASCPSPCPLPMSPSHPHAPCHLLRAGGGEAGAQHRPVG